jgi:hypothetical protein
VLHPQAERDRDEREQREQVPLLEAVRAVGGVERRFGEQRGGEGGADAGAGLLGKIFKR